VVLRLGWRRATLHILRLPRRLTARYMRTLRRAARLTCGATGRASTAGLAARRTIGRPFAARRGRLAGGRVDHGERHAMPLLIDRHDPNLDNVADRHHLVWIADVLVGQLADVNQTAVFQAEIDKRAEIDDVEHG